MRADALVFAASFILYLRTLAPTVYIFDSAELAAGAYSLGIVHATGYPLYLMLVKLFTLLVPWGDIAWRANLFSALCASITLVVLRRVAVTLGAAPASALAAVAILGVSFPLWSEAVAAEVYTLHTALLAVILLLALRWRATGRARDFVLLGLTLGLSFGNHLATILLLPGLAFLVWRVARSHRPSPAAWIGALALGTLGPLTYLYLPLRYAASPAVNYATALGVDLRSVDGILWMVRGRMFGEFMFGYRPAELPGEAARFLGMVWDAFLGVGVPVAAFGALEQWRRDRTACVTLGAILVATVVFFVNYRVPDNHTMFLPVFVVLTLWMATGLHALAAALARDESERYRVRALAAGVVFLVVALLWTNFPGVDLSGFREPRQYAERVLRAAPPDAFILGGWVNITPLLYLQAVEGQRRDVELYDWGLVALGRRAALRSAGMSREQALQMARQDTLQRVRRELLTGRAVLALEADDLLAEHFTLVPRDDLYVVCDAGDCADPLAPGRRSRP